MMPAIIVIGFWFVLQFMSSIGSFSASTGDEGGVAYLAHVGGFIAGFGIAFILSRFKV
jgi:membrane associated rhomboid family serine protease